MPQRILIIDDDEDNLDILSSVLAEDHYNILSLTNADNLASDLLTFNPDLLLLDISLANADGRVICNNLKSDDATKHIKVVLISAKYSEKDSVKEGLMACDFFIAKPFDIDELSASIKDVLNGQLDV